MDLHNFDARNPNIINVKPRILEDTRWLQPVANLWTKSAQKWVVLNEQMLNYDGQPPDFSKLFERFRDQS